MPSLKFRLQPVLLSAATTGLWSTAQMTLRGAFGGVGSGTLTANLVATLHSKVSAKTAQALVGLQPPPAHCEAAVQAMPSSQATPSLAALCKHAPVEASQLSAVHGFLSSHDLGVLAAVHLPLPQAAATHLSALVHGKVLASKLQLPVMGSQPSVVHTLPSSQLVAVPVHLPCTQASLAVHLLPSSHGGLAWFTA